MKYLNFIKITLFSILFFSSISFAGLYKYTSLQVKNYDEMKALVNKNIDLSQSILQRKDLGTDEKESKAITPLKDSLRMIFSRPDKDNMVSKLYPRVKKQLDGLHTLNLALNEITTEAIIGIKKERLSKSYRATYVFVLENLMTELRPEVKDNKDIRKIFQKIRDAKIKIPASVVSYRKFYGMYRTLSPSKVAQKILEPYEKKK